MASRFQACKLVSPPMYPNAIAWSEENLIAVATGHIVTILNPALPCGPRGMITLPPAKHFQFGLIEKEDLSSPGMLPICLSRYNIDRPCVRSVAWSPIGMAPNAGCLLAVCTLEGQVKVYRSPYCEFGVEWVEIIDVAELLFDHLSKINFEESNMFGSRAPSEHAPQPSQALAQDDNLPINISHKRVRNEDSEPLGGIQKFFKPVVLPCSSQLVNSEGGNGGLPFHADESSSSITQREIIPFPNINNNCSTKFVPIQPKKRGKENISRGMLNSIGRKTQESSGGPLISAEEYISRNAMMSPLIVAWSSLMSSSSEGYTHDRFSLLAVGGKSGKVSFWRVQKPLSYSIKNNDFPITTIFVGFLHAHNAWITAISWVTLEDDLSNDQVVLVTGSADGSVKIWFQNENELLCSEDGQVSLNLMTEICAVDCSPVSTLSVAVHVESLDRLVLAIGKGSGSFEVWSCDLLLKFFDKIGTYNTHDHVITGLAWAFGGRCLYSCSQDNCFQSWILRDGSLCEAAIPSNTPGIISSLNDIPNASDSSFGIAISHGNMVLAMARSFDATLLDPMYQARILKGAVEFFWIGGQEVKLLPDTRLEDSPVFSVKKLLHWSTNMLSSLEHFEDSNKHLVIWDVLAALLKFKDSRPEYVEYVLARWLTTLFALPNVSSSSEEILDLATTRLEARSCRQLHIINIICRRVVLSNFIEEEHNDQQLLPTTNADEQKLQPLWMKFLSHIEREIRERLVGLSFSAASYLMPCSSCNSPGTEIWRPLGLAQMQQWVSLNDHLVPDKLKDLASKVGLLIDKPQENCMYCATSVAFESPEVAYCTQSHKLERCAVSMQLLPSTIAWYCICCRRRAFTIAPGEFFTMSRHPVNYVTESSSSPLKAPTAPLCPFCGILQQRGPTPFLLSPSPV